MFLFFWNGISIKKRPVGRNSGTAPKRPIDIHVIKTIEQTGKNEKFSFEVVRYTHEFLTGMTARFIRKFKDIL